jgi:hypothetical protein
VHLGHVNTTYIWQLHNYCETQFQNFHETSPHCIEGVKRAETFASAHKASKRKMPARQRQDVDGSVGDRNGITGEDGGSDAPERLAHGIGHGCD